MLVIVLGGCFVTMIVLVGWMLLPSFSLEPLCTLSMLYPFCMFSCVVVSRFIGCVFPPFFLLFLFGVGIVCHMLVVICNRLNNLCLLKFFYRIALLLMKYVLRHVKKKDSTSVEVII